MANPSLKLVQHDDDPKPVRLPPAVRIETPPPAEPESEPAPGDVNAPEPVDVREADRVDVREAEADESAPRQRKPPPDLALAEDPVSRPVLTVNTAAKPQKIAPLQVEEREPEVLNVPRKEPEAAQEKKAIRLRKHAVRPRRHSNRKPRPVGKVVVHRKSSARPALLGERYEIISTLGVGGAGTVYHALDQLLETEVAIKVLDPDLAENEELMHTLKHEARMAMQLSNTHIVRLHNVESLGNTLALVMEYVDGETLREIIQECGSFNVETVSQILTACDRGISQAHRHNILHADLNPSNIMLSRDGVIKIIDFGEACIPSTEIEDGEWIAGTPPYMAPEQKAGQSIDARTDIYGLGITAYQLLTGQVPYPAGATHNQMLQIVPAELPLLENPLRSILEAAIAPDPDQRWQTVQDFAEAFADAASQMT
ncbi:MAG: serine/threonine-protein kinase [Verrucomicrobia bacterium]|nr:serine/threonine-protein kinase [Verrucomicrobiota bacterium]